MSNYIFDVDGTLIDSYGGILESVIDVLKMNNYNMPSDEALDFILKYSVRDLMIKVSSDLNISLNELMAEFNKSRLDTQYKYNLMSNCLPMLNELKNKGAKLFIFTHKGDAIKKIINDDFKDLFIEVIYSTGDNFKRKPSGYSIDYLVNKYNLDKEDTYYVGDRPIDIECAYNSKIKSIFYKRRNVSLDYKPNYIIDDLIKIVDIERK